MDLLPKLCVGAGNGVDAACLMTATNMLIGKPQMQDASDCVCPVLQAFIIPTNDDIGNFSRELLQELYGPLVWEILGTRNDDMNVIRQRGYRMADWAVRRILPIMLRSIKCNTDAQRFESLPTITDKDSAAYAAYAADAAAHAHAAYAADAAAHAADAAAHAHAAYAADAAAYAADAAAYADAAARAHAADAADAVWRLCPEIVRDVASIGDRRPVETVLTNQQLCEMLN